MLQTVSSSSTNGSTLQASPYTLPLSVSIADPSTAQNANLQWVLNYLLQFLPEDALQNVLRSATPKVEQKPISVVSDSVKNLERLALPTLEGLEIVEIKDILFCEANSNYTIFHFVNQPKIMVSRTLKEISSTLAAQPFFRVHQSYLVNLKHIQKYVKGSGGYLILVNGKSVNVSKSKKEALVKRLLEMR